MHVKIFKNKSVKMSGHTVQNVGYWKNVNSTLFTLFILLLTTPGLKEAQINVQTTVSHFRLFRAHFDNFSLVFGVFVALE